MFIVKLLPSNVVFASMYRVSPVMKLFVAVFCSIVPCMSVEPDVPPEITTSPLAFTLIASRAVPDNTLFLRSWKLTLEVTGLAPPVSFTNTVISSAVSVVRAGSALILTPIILSY